jgi:hypothetical protein
MILILSEHQDPSTDFVCNWLKYYKADFVRTNNETNNYNIYGKIVFADNKLVFELEINGKTYNLDEISCIWCRRGYLHVKLPKIEDLNFTEPKILDTISTHLNNEIATLYRFFLYLISEKTHINNPNHYNSNKLIALRTAQKVGLKIPETLITQDASELKQFHKKHKNIITKNIQDLLIHQEENYNFGHATQNVDLQDIITETFFYSLFQQKINRKYELRIFYLLGKFFAHASFPPANTDAADIRDTGGKNTFSSFELPKQIKGKLHKFMTIMELESGSIDMIVDKNDDYYFLEVNPVGQFGYVSGYNNYFIEREIAKTLINFENKTQQTI